MCWTTVHYTQTNTKNVNKTWALLQTTGSKDEPISNTDAHQQTGMNSDAHEG